MLFHKKSPWISTGQLIKFSLCIHIYRNNTKMSEYCMGHQSFICFKKIPALIWIIPLNELDNCLLEFCIFKTIFTIFDTLKCLPEEKSAAFWSARIFVCCLDILNVLYPATAEHLQLFKPFSWSSFLSQQIKRSWNVLQLHVVSVDKSVIRKKGTICMTICILFFEN